MTIFAHSWIAVLGIFLLINLFRTVRSYWVYRVRNDLLSANYEIYKELPNRDFMIRKWWIWDASRFIGMKDYKPTKKERSVIRGAAIIAKASRSAEKG